MSLPLLLLLSEILHGRGVCTWQDRVINGKRTKEGRRYKPDNQHEEGRHGREGCDLISVEDLDIRLEKPKPYNIIHDKRNDGRDERRWYQPHEREWL